MCICCIYVYLLYYMCIDILTLDAGLLARSQYPEIESARARADSISFHMHNCLAIKIRVVSFYCLRTVLSEYNS